VLATGHREQRARDLGIGGQQNQITLQPAFLKFTTGVLEITLRKEGAKHQI